MTVSQTRMAQDVCLTLGVELDRGQLTLHGVDALALSDAVHRVGQAMVRVADIWFTFQPRAIKTIGDEVDEWLREQRFEFQKLRPYPGRSGRIWTVDYEILASTRRSLVFLLSTSNPSWARAPERTRRRRVQRPQRPAATTGEPVLRLSLRRLSQRLARRGFRACRERLADCHLVAAG